MDCRRDIGERVAFFMEVTESQLFNSMTATVVMARLLASCGGGSDGNSAPGGTSAAPTPSPSPSPTPSPTPSMSQSNTYPAAPAGAAGPLQFDAVGWAKNHQTGAIKEISPDQFSVRWDGISRYDTVVADVGTGRLRYFFGRNANPSVFSLEPTDGGIIPIAISWVVTEPLLARPESVFWHYPASGTAPSPPTEHSGTLILGHLTVPAHLPASGSRSYRFEREGEGAARVDVNFAPRAITAAFSVSYRDAWGPYPPIPAVVSDAVLLPDGTGFTARYTLPGVPGEGVLKGRFFGPGAQYLGLLWKGPIKEPYENGVYDIFGAWRLEQSSQ